MIAEKIDIPNTGVRETRTLVLVEVARRAARVEEIRARQGSAPKIA